jgi:hypothetical protein
MAREIRLDQISDYLEGRMDQLLRVTVLETDSRLKRASPVDTGRFRASWQVGENAAPGGVAPEGQFDTRRTFKTSKRGRTTQEVLPIQRLGYGQEKIGNVYSVHNNLPYAEPLATGVPHGSKQASPGWVEGIAKDMQTFVINNAAKIGKES